MPNFDVNLKLLLDPEAYARVESGVSKLEDEMAALSQNDIKLFDNERLAEAEKYFRALVNDLNDIAGTTKEGLRFQQIQNEIANRMRVAEKERLKTLRESNDELKKGAGWADDVIKKVQENRHLNQQFGKDLLKDGGAKTPADVASIASNIYAKREEIIKQGEKAEKARAKEALKTASAYKQQVQELRHVATAARNIESIFGSAGMKLQIAGVSVVGGILAEANRYAKEAGSATEATRQWNEQLSQMGKQRQRIDENIVREALPVIQTATKLLSIVADIVDSHPEIIGSALKGGMILVALGGITKAVSKGIGLVADIATITASTTNLVAGKTMKEAARDMLVSAGLMKKGGVGGIVSKAFGGGTVTTVAATASTVLSIVGAIVAGGAIGAWINDLLAKHGVKGFIRTNTFATGGAYEVGKVFGKAGGLDEKEIDRKATVFAAIIGKLTGAIDKSSPLWKKATSGIEGLNSELEKMGGLANSPVAQQIADAFADWQKDDAAMVSKAVADRAKVIADADKELASSAKKYADSVQKINASFSGNRASIISKYAGDMSKMEASYTQDRAKIIQDGGEAIQNIERDNQEKLQKLAEEHNLRVNELVAQRDALGLAREMRKYDQERGEAEKGTNEAIAREKRETAMRLQELAQRYTQERSERARQYAEDLAENAKQRAEELKRAAEEHKQEVAQIRQQKAEKLAEIEKTLREEKARRMEYFLQQVRDLDSTLLGERNTRLKYYSAMISDADAFLKKYRSSLSGTGTVTSGGSTLTATASGSVAPKTSTYSNYPVRDFGGYTEKGIYRMAWNGRREFVASGDTTRFAENAIGGKMTQENMRLAYSALGRSSAGNSLGNVNLSFPGGMMSIGQIKDYVDVFQDEFIEKVTRAING